jgi:hypothetical protein
MRVSNLFSLVAFAFPMLIDALAISDTTSNSLSAFGKRDIVSTILTDIENLVTCAACEVSLQSFLSKKFLTNSC